MVIAPEHPLVAKLPVTNRTEVESYVTATRAKTDIDRTAEGKEKTGVELRGVKAINPATKEEIPVWEADYVLAGYGTGAIMAVPAHDERDFAFASKFGLPIRRVIEGGELPYTGEGALIGSGIFDGLSVVEAKKKITDFVGGKLTTTFKLRDWVFSRQRYWGEPIPMVRCEKDGWVPVPESELPLELPQVEKYQPTDTGESPLANITEWVNTECPKCHGPARRETDVMPNWAGSSWYYLRYCDPHNDTTLADKKKLEYWTPVDWYNGGMEHTVLHLLYSRFWHKFLYDIGVVPTSEPYKKRTSHGMILAENGMKMSKSKGNVINPDEMVERFGADALRVYEMFMGPFDQAIAWSTDGLVGMYRFLERVWALPEKTGDMPVSGDTEIAMNQAVKKVGEDIEQMKFNTALSQLMIYSNELTKLEKVPKEAYETLLGLLAPFAPHMTEELWERAGHGSSLHEERWPSFDASKLQSDTVTIAVQVAGKTRGTVTVPREAGQEAVLAAIQADTRLAGVVPAKPSRVIFVPGKVVNIIG